MKIASLLAVPALFLAVSAHAAPKVGEAAPAVSTRDIKDRDVTVPASGKVMVLTFVSKGTGDTGAKINAEVRVSHPEAEYVTFIDFSSFPGFMKGMVKSKVKTRHEEALKDNTEAFKKAGKDAPADLDAKIHLVPDFDARIVQEAYGFKDTGKQANYAIVGADGKVVALFDKTPTAADVKAAVEKAGPAK